MKKQLMKNIFKKTLPLLLLVTFFAYFGIVDLHSLPYSLKVVGSIGIGIFTFIVLAQTTDDHPNTTAHKTTISKLISILLLFFIFLSFYSAINNFAITPQSANFYQRDMYADITTVASYLSIILEILLATIQSKNYWVFKKRYVEFDERQTEDRHVIFEKSYKYMFAAAYLGLVPFITFMIALPKIVENNNGFFPGYIFWLPINVVTLLFTLPYILASFRNK